MRVVIKYQVEVVCEEKQAGEIIQQLSSTLSDVGGSIVLVRASTEPVEPCQD